MLQPDFNAPARINIEKILRKEAKALPKKDFDLQHYIGTKLEVLGLPSATQKRISTIELAFNDLTLEERLKIWDELWQKSPIFEALSQSLLFCDKYRRKGDPLLLWETISGWTKRIDNWAHSDALSGQFARLMLKIPESILPSILAWNRSDNQWEKRISAVTLLLFCRKTKNEFPAGNVFPLLGNLLKDNNKFVQKGLGWALRDLAKPYPEQVWHFLIENATILSPIAFSIAMEKRNKQEKEYLMQLRKESRKKIRNVLKAN